MSSIETKQQQVEATLRLAPVVPVVIIEDAKATVLAAGLLLGAQAGVLEVVAQLGNPSASRCWAPRRSSRIRC